MATPSDAARRRTRSQDTANGPQSSHPRRSLDERGRRSPSRFATRTSINMRPSEVMRDQQAQNVYASELGLKHSAEMEAEEDEAQQEQALLDAEKEKRKSSRFSFRRMVNEAVGDRSVDLPHSDSAADNEGAPSEEEEAVETKEERLSPILLSGWELIIEYGVIDPKWKQKVRWDSFMGLLLLFTALVTPFEVSFLNPEYSVLFWLNRLVDLGFLLDMIASFHLAFESEVNKKMVYDSRAIKWRYINGWFAVDLVSLFPFDIWQLSGPSDNQIVTSGLRLMRLVKLLRLVRTGRLLKPGGMLYTQKVNFNTLNMILFVLLLLFFSHWTACLWRLIPLLENSKDTNWLDRMIPDYHLGETDNGLPHVTDDNVDEYRKSMTNIMELYITSLYWSTMTVTTIGYGDVVPETTVEKWFVIVVMLIGGLIFGYIIGAVSNVVQSANAKENEYHMAMSDLKLFLIELRLPEVLQDEIKVFFQRLHNSIDVNAYHYYTELLSPALKAKLLLYMNRNWITRVPHFQGVSQTFIVRVAEILTRHLFPPKEVIVLAQTMPREVFIVNKGIAAGNNRLFTVGHLIGSDALVLTYKTRSYSARAITYTECSRLDREQLFALLEQWPAIKRRFRLLAIKSIFRDEIKAYCVAMRTVRVMNHETRHELGRRLGATFVMEDEDKWVRDYDSPLNNRVRLNDLFNKNQRTIFYTKKLQVLYPPTAEEREEITIAATIIQRMFRGFLNRADTVSPERAGNSNLNAPLATTAIASGRHASAARADTVFPRVGSTSKLFSMETETGGVVAAEGSAGNIIPEENGSTPAHSRQPSIPRVSTPSRRDSSQHQQAPTLRPRAPGNVPFGPTDGQEMFSNANRLGRDRKGSFSYRDHTGSPMGDLGSSQEDPGMVALHLQLQQVLSSQSTMLNFIKMQQDMYTHMQSEINQAMADLARLSS